VPLSKDVELSVMMEAKKIPKTLERTRMRHGNNGVARSASPSKAPLSKCLMFEKGSYADFIKRARGNYNQLWKAMGIQDTADEGIRSTREKVEEAVREELARVTGRSNMQIDECLCHGEYLTDECLLELGQMGAEEDFFVEAQHLKVILIKNALVKGQGREEITREISAAILEMYREYQETRKVNATKWLRDRIESSEAKPKRTSGIELFGKPQLLQYGPPKKDAFAQKPLTLAEISVRLEGLAQTIRKIVEGRNKGKAGMTQRLAKLTIEMAKLHHEARHKLVSSKERERDG
jgi:hypothetical protein